MTALQVKERLTISVMFHPAEGDGSVAVAFAKAQQKRPGSFVV